MASPSVVFTKNVIEITAQAGTQLSANGAGLYLDGRGSGWMAGLTKGTTNLHNVTIDSNRVTATGDITIPDSSANGGGALINHIAEFNYTNGIVSNNTAEGKNVGHVQGGGISFEYVGANGTAIINLTDVDFTGNKAKLDTGSTGTPGSGAFAMGGGFVVNSTNTVPTLVTVGATSPADKVLFEGNSVTLTGDLNATAGKYGAAAAARSRLWNPA